MKRFFTALTCAALLSGAANAQQNLPEIPVDAKFVTGEFNWTSQRSKMEFSWAVRQINGQLHVCGAVTHSNTRALQNNRYALIKGWVKVDGKKVLRNLSFFNDLGVGGDLTKARARCKPVPVKGQARFTLGWDPIRVRI